LEADACHCPCSLLKIRLADRPHALLYTIAATPSTRKIGALVGAMAEIVGSSSLRPFDGAPTLITIER
jgi:hypothetical protein